MNKSLTALHAVAAAAFLTLSGCSLIPTYERPALAVPAQLSAEDAKAADAQAARAVADLPCDLIPDVDHTVSTLHAQRRLIDAVTRFAAHLN